MADVTPTGYSSRSRKMEYQRCPRARLVGHHNRGRIIVLVRMAIPLATGIHVHTGIGHLLVDGAVEVAVKNAIDAYREEIETRGLDYQEGEDAYFVANEQMALTEALVRAYHHYQLPKLLAEYTVLEVERNDDEHMAIIHDAEGAPVNLRWKSRADALLLEKATGDLQILSLKTAASWDDRRDNENRHDDQGLSEVWAVEQRLKRFHDGRAEAGEGLSSWPREMVIKGFLAAPSPPRIQAIKMEFLIKGSRNEVPKGSKHYVTYNHLIRAWRRLGVTPSDDSFAWRWEWYGPDTDDVGQLKKHRLSPKVWKPFNVWEADDIGGIKGWIEMLASGRVQPEAEDPFESLVVTPMPYFRQEDDMNDWFAQTVAIEERVAQDVTVVDAIDQGDLVHHRHELNRRFPQNKRACFWPSKCPFHKICFDLPFGSDPVDSGLYQIRPPIVDRKLEVPRQ